MKNSKLKQILITFLTITLTSSYLVTSSNPIETKAKEKFKTTKIKNSSELNRKLVGYFPEWAYSSEAQGYFNVTDLQWDSLTHIQYSFAMVDPSTNKITLSNKHAAIEED